MSNKKRIHKGFSLVELVVVILIMGILAAVAAPKMFDRAQDARENGTRQSLTTLRDALEMYRVEHNGYPTTTNLAVDLRTYLKGPFPEVQVGSNKNDSVVAATGSPITAAVSGSPAGWQYNTSTGEIAINDAGYVTW